MLERDVLERIDAGGMHSVYDGWPQMAIEAYEPDDAGSEPPVTFESPVTHVVFAGMGGSGTVGDLFAAILSKTPVHVTVTKGYELPRTADRDTLVIATSISGNTRETASVLESAVRRTDVGNIVAVSSGGDMAGFCRDNGVRRIGIARTHSPRASLVSVVFAMLRALQDVLPLRRSDVTEAVARLEEMRGMISSANLNCDGNAAQRTAERLGAMPLIYYPFGLQAAAIRFKNSLQENAKTHAATEDVVEACHNGITAWERPSRVSPVIITGSDDHPRTRERWGILRGYFESRGIAYEEMRSGPGGILAKLMGLIYWADYASIYRAVIDGIDPSPVESIDFVKSRL